NPNPPVVQGQPQLHFAAQPQTTSLIQGSLIIEGDVIPNRDRSLKVAVKLPTELDAPLPVGSAVDNPASATNTLNVFNAGSNSSDTGTLGTITNLAGIATDYVVPAGSVNAAEFGLITGLNMGTGITLNYGTAQNPNNVTYDGGITYHDIQVVNVMMGRGNDTLTVNATTPGSITVIQGGGGDDHLIANGGAAGSALILFGDTSQDGSFYNSTTQLITGHAREFNNPGNDTLDASNDAQPVVLYGGAGNDTILGGPASDWIAGGGGHDAINGANGNDIIFGDDGFNLDLSKRLSLSSQVLLTVNAASSATDDPLTSDKLVAGGDQIRNGTGNDIIIGDHGVVTQIAGTNRILTTGQVIAVQTVRPEDAGNDTITLGAGNNVVLGGSGSDTINSGAGNQIILGDNGAVTYSVPGTVSSVTTSDVVTVNSQLTLYGAGDIITVGAGNDLILGGLGGDTILLGNGNSDIIGDEGQLFFTSAGLLIQAQTNNPGYGGNDTITAGNGSDIILGGVGSDTITAGNGGSIIVGDNGRIVWSSPGILSLVTTTDVTYGAGDSITTGNGNDIIIGGSGGDTIKGGDGNNLIIGDNGNI